MYKITQIIANQEKFKDEITAWFSEQISEAKQDLQEIKTDDKFINKEKKKLENKFKKIKVKNYLKRLFFLDSKRNEDYYVWWDETQGEAVILSYGKS